MNVKSLMLCRLLIDACYYYKNYDLLKLHVDHVPFFLCPSHEGTEAKKETRGMECVFGDLGSHPSLISHLFKIG